MSPLFACLRSPRLPAAAVAVAKDFSPRLQRYGDDSVVLDVGGLGRLLGEPPIIAEELDRAMRWHRSTWHRRRSADDSPEHAIGVAPTQIAAMLLSSARPGVTVATDDVPAALAPLRLETLRHVVAEMHGGTLRRGAAVTRAATFWESAEKAFEVAERWGLTTIGEFAALPADELAARLGQVGERAAAGWRAESIASPLVPDPDVPRFFERDRARVADRRARAAVVRPGAPARAAVGRRSSAPIAALPRSVSICGSSIAPCIRACCSCRPPMRDRAVLRTLLMLDLESHPPHAAIDIVTVEVDPAPGRVIQYSLLERARPSAETLATLTARLDALVGESRCGSTGASRFASVRMRSRCAASRRTNAAPHARALHGQLPRASDRQAPALRRFRPPIAIRVTVERGRPALRVHRSPRHAGRHGRAMRGAVALVRRLVERSVTAMESRRVGRGAERRLGLPVVPGTRHRPLVPGGGDRLVGTRDSADSASRMLGIRYPCCNPCAPWL